MRKPDRITVEQAVEALTVAARRDFPSLEAQLKAAGFGITGYEPLQGTPDIDSSAASDIGAVIKRKGIYHGAWQARRNGAIVQVYSDTDLLKDASGKQLLLTWYQTRDELVRRNGGRSYGDGTEAALCDALAKPPGTRGAFRDGDLVMAPMVLLNGRDVDGDKVRAHNTFDLLSASEGNAFENISKTLSDGSDYARWSWSCTEGRDDSSGVRIVSISDGSDDWFNKVNYRLAVLPFRVFREPHAAKPVSHLNI